jgi:hypothetical protein
MSTSPWEEVRRLADEVRVKMHLAGMELKDKWKALEPQLQDVEQKLKAGGERAGGVITTQVDAIAAGLRQFADELSASVKDARSPKSPSPDPALDKDPKPSE